jgi:ABC-type polysaccharide/polyol phosphate transport system ATPase subunit
MMKTTESLSAFDSTLRVSVDQLSRKYCTHLKRSLWYGLQDIVSEFNLRHTGARAKLRPHEFWALQDISFEVHAGEALAVIGPNGAGKSTLLKLLSGLIKPDRGRINLHGRVGSLIELGSGFQPALTGRENIYINAAMLGLSDQQVKPLVAEIIDFAEIGAFIDTPLGNYSSGMWVRLAYAIATCLKPDVLLVDEVLAVGDLAFQRKCMQHLLTYLRNGGTLILVSHNLYMVQNICARSLVLDRGRVVFAGTAVEGVQHYFEAKAESQRTSSVNNKIAAAKPDDLVSIEGVEVLPATEGELQTDAPARVVIHYHAREDISRVHCAFTFWTPDLLVCITGQRTETKLAESRLGRSQFACFIPRLPLTAGTYSVRAVIGDNATGVPLAMFGYQSAPANFIVKSTPSELSNLYTLASALITLDAKWE